MDSKLKSEFLSSYSSYGCDLSSRWGNTTSRPGHRKLYMEYNIYIEKIILSLTS